MATESAFSTTSISTGPFVLLLGALPLILFAVVSFRERRNPLSNIRGPPSKSWLLGATEELYTGEMSKVQAEWTEKYGHVVSFKACLNEQWLLVTDPKAIHHMQMRPYFYGKHRYHAKRTQKALGIGLSTIDGDLHKRLRRIMLPSFGWTEINSMEPMFWGIMDRLANVWGRRCDEANGSIEINMAKETAKIALDAVGDAGLGHPFHAVESGDGGFALQLNSVIPRAFAQPNTSSLIRTSLLNRLPQWLSNLIVRKPNQNEKDIATFASESLTELKDTAARLVAEKKTRDIDDEKDLVSRMIQAGDSNNPKTRMSDEEVINQIMTFFVAGEDTTATVLACMFHELSQNPDLQTSIRNEVNTADQAALADGFDHIPAQVLNELPLVDAMVKECLRFYPAFPRRDRYIDEADILPLSKPLVGRNGEKIENLYLPKGTSIMIGIQEYNRSEAIWGQDSRLFRPERWLEKEVKVNLAQGSLPGVWSSLYSFGGGAYACIGYRFALLEIKTALAGLIKAFKFTPARSGGVKIRMENGLVDFPKTVNEEEKGRYLPICVEKVET